MAEDTIVEQVEKSVTGWKKHFDKIFGISSLTLLFALAGFYFNTKSSIAANTDQIAELKKNYSLVIEILSDIKEQREKNKQEIKDLKELVIELKDGKRESDLRLDKIYEIVLDVNKSVKGIR